MFKHPFLLPPYPFLFCLFFRKIHCSKSEWSQPTIHCCEEKSPRILCLTCLFPCQFQLKICWVSLFKQISAYLREAILETLNYIGIWFSVTNGNPFLKWVNSGLYTLLLQVMLFCHIEPIHQVLLLVLFISHHQGTELFHSIKDEAGMIHEANCRT